jgi:hypothetical protein
MVLHLVYLVFLAGSAVAAFIYRRHLQHRGLFLFPYYLLLVSLQELFVFTRVLKEPGYSTGLIYNVYNPVNTVFFCWFYSRIPFNAKHRRLILLLLLVFLLAVGITFCFVQPVSVYNNYLSLAGGFLITLCGLLFLFNYFNLDNPGEEKKWMPVILITIGLVTFYPVVNISFALYTYLQSYRATIFGLKLYRLVPQLMSIFMYACFIRAFYLCSRKS